MKSNLWHHPKYDLHYYSAGDSNKPVAIFLHGFMGTGEDWQEIIEKLSGDFYCIAVDLPGHGKTRVHGPITDYSMESFSKCFTKFVKSLELGSPILIGYSMGGRLALFLTVYFNSTWSGAIFESATPGLRQEKQRAERRSKDAKLIKKLEKEPFEIFLDEWYKQPLFETITKTKSYDALVKRRIKNDQDGLVKSLKMMGLGVQPSLWDACKKINIPILLLAGEFDRKFCNIMKDMQNINSDFKIKIVENAGHNVHVEQPDAYFEQVNKFLFSIRETRT